MHPLESPESDKFALNIVRELENISGNLGLVPRDRPASNEGSFSLLLSAGNKITISLF